MLGTIVNAAAILIGGAIGLLLKKGIPERVSNCTFGGVEENELFITATTSLYRVQLTTAGCQYTHLIDKNSRQ